MIRRVVIVVSALLLGGGVALAAEAKKKYGPGVSDNEIRLGQTMPYSGPFSPASVIGRAESAYFTMLNAQGGVNGRRVTLRSLDDGYNPAKTLEQTRRLVEQDEVLAIMGSFGTPPNTAIQKYLNDRQVPQLFIQAGASRWNDPAHFPWRIPFVNLLRSEAKAYGAYILRTTPKARIAVLYQNDDFGRDYLDGLTERLGDDTRRVIVATASYESSDPTVDQQIITLEASGADTLLIAAGPKFAAQAIGKAFDLGWHPTRFIAEVSASRAVLAPVGPERARGLIVATSIKSIGDPQWAEDPDMSAWRQFMRDYYPQGDVGDELAFVGYSNAAFFAEVLRRCGDDLTREHLLAVATHLDGIRTPALLPGMTISTSPVDYDPLKQMRLARFDGQRWVLLSGGGDD